MYKEIIASILDIADKLDEKSRPEEADILAQMAARLAKATSIGQSLELLVKEEVPEIQHTPISLEPDTNYEAEPIPMVASEPETPVQQGPSVKEIVATKALEIMNAELYDPMIPDDFKVELRKNIENNYIPENIWNQAIRYLVNENILVQSPTS